MRSESLLTLLAAALAVATTSSRHEWRADEAKDDLPLLKAEDQARVVPGRFIVEFEPVRIATFNLVKASTSVLTCYSPPIAKLRHDLSTLARAIKSRRHLKTQTSSSALV